MADDAATAQVLVDALTGLVRAARERIGQDALDYLLTGVRSGRVLSDPTDPQLRPCAWSRDGIAASEA